MFGFLKMTVIGGVLFLIPVVVLIMVIGKALQVSNKLAQPLAGILPFDSVGGLAIANILAVVLVLVVCFVAGLLARTAIARRAVGSLETNVLSNLPVYDLIKSKVQATVQAEQLQDITPVVVRFDDQRQIAFEIERLDDGGVVVFLPGAPDPWSGTLAIMDAERIQPLDATMGPVIKILKTLGKGSRQHLHPAR